MTAMPPDVRAFFTSELHTRAHLLRDTARLIGHYDGTGEATALLGLAADTIGDAERLLREGTTA